MILPPEGTCHPVYILPTTTGPGHLASRLGHLHAKEAKRRERLMVSYGPKGKMGKAEKGSGFSNKKNMVIF